MNIDEIPTPETDAAEAACRESKGCVNLVFVNDMAALERRLTIARDALDRISIWSTENSVLDVARITLTKTAPKP